MPDRRFLARETLDELLAVIAGAGYGVVGPVARDGAIQFQPLHSADELPTGVRDDQQPGRYRLEQTTSPRQFAWANGPQAIKPQVFAPRETLWRVERDGGGRLEFRQVRPAAPPLAIFGVRACDLAALAIQDQHFLGTMPADPHYEARRSRLLLVAINCSHPAATCFCASTGDGPSAKEGYDLLLDELDDGFLVRAGSEAGASLLEVLQLPPASGEQIAEAMAQRERAVLQQKRSLPSTDLYQVLFARLEHPRWQATAERCLSCGNCTAVCPTCFCHSERDEPALDLQSSEHLREWDSCFSAGHSILHGVPVRGDTRMRYRQWLTHKLASWHQQYGRSGCVGCGRCISWCPVGIDLTEEVAELLGGET